MSATREFLEALETLLDDIPCKLSTKIQAESRGDIALYLNDTIVFTDHSELHFKEDANEIKVKSEEVISIAKDFIKWWFKF